MKIIDRYILKELCLPFGISLVALCFIVFTKEMLRIVELLISKGIGVLSVLKIIVHLMPSFLVLTLPIACLIASISTFSRFSYEKELVAMRAAGISWIRILVPLLTFSTLVFGLTLYLSQWGQPWSNINLKHLAKSLIEDQLTLALDRGIFNKPKTNLVIYVPEPREGQNVQGIFISDQRNSAKPLIITAKNFRMLNDPDHNHLGIQLLDGAIHQTPRDASKHHQVEFNTYDLKMDFLLVREPKRMSYTSIMKKLEETRWQNTNALRRLMEHYKDIAFPIATLIFGVLGLPIGVMSKRSSQIGGFAIGILIMVGYYLLNILGEFSVTTLTTHPFIGAWIPNIILTIITGMLFYRTSLR